MNRFEAEIEDKEEVCVHCGSTPCKWCEFGPELLNRDAYTNFFEEHQGVIIIFNDFGDRIGNKEMWKSLYHMFTYMNYGHLGCGFRIPLPKCVSSKIQAMVPAGSGDYMGFKHVPSTEAGSSVGPTPSAEPRRKSSRLAAGN